mmetsp:Transcript_2853/g.17726  ORF Transcript_2853/g.17726 Transcript_2853/m.17726 type:complete len:201 (+) Transcript_2853:1048-1650(+)
MREFDRKERVRRTWKGCHARGGDGRGRIRGLPRRPSTASERRPSVGHGRVQRVLSRPIEARQGRHAAPSRRGDGGRRRQRHQRDACDAQRGDPLAALGCTAWCAICVPRREELRRRQPGRFRERLRSRKDGRDALCVRILKQRVRGRCDATVSRRRGGLPATQPVRCHQKSERAHRPRVQSHARDALHGVAFLHGVWTVG